MHHPISAEMRKCIEACQKCHNTCLQLAMSHSQESGGPHLEPAHFRLMIDCAAICQFAADFMLRGSHFLDQTCQLCAAICELCAQGCEQAGGMADCAQSCRRCAESCRQVIESMVVKLS
jgi:hypothetical protein